MDEAMRNLSEIESDSYALAKKQAAAIYEYLVEHDECCVMILDVGETIFELNITHVDVLNELYCMLENLQHLAE